MDFVLIRFRRTGTRDARRDVEYAVTHAAANLELGVRNGFSFHELAGSFPQVEFRRVRLAFY
jgi:hypothetical protein